MEYPKLGVCELCHHKQTKLAKEGYWILYGGKVKWICHKCKSSKQIRSYPVACEWCNYDHVVWYQGHTYDCPRCTFYKLEH